LGWFVQQQDLGAACQYSPEGQLLLLATAQGASQPAPHLFEDGKEGVDLLQRFSVYPAIRGGFKTEQQVLVNGQSGKDTPALGYVPQPSARTLAGGPSGDGFILQEHFASVRFEQSH